MPNLRLIRIVAQGNGAAFEPDPSGVQGGDTVRWNNETNEDHWIETTTGVFLTNNIPAGEVSNPGAVADATIAYRCRLHPQETGRIEIVPAVMAPVMAAAAAMTAAGGAPVAAPATSSAFAARAAAAVGGGASAARKRKAKKPAQRKKAAKKKGRAKMKGG
jgi:hypothetical protein